MFLAQRMNTIIKLVRTYRVTTGFADRLRLAEDIFRLIEPDLRFFIFGSVSPQAADDVLQETLKAVATGMGKFAGGTAKEFWGWCYQIARNIVGKHFREESRGRIISLDPEEIARLLDASASDEPYAADEEQDLKEALGLLKKSDPDCFELLWSFFILGFNYKKIATQSGLDYDNVRIKIRRCVDYTQTLLD